MEVSLTLWSLIADSLLMLLTQQEIFAQGYADDGVALVVGSILSTIGFSMVQRSGVNKCNCRLILKKNGDEPVYKEIQTRRYQGH